MRVFYVRPSDNGNYGIEAALANCQRRIEELHVALFRGACVPLEPLNFDPREQGLAHLNRYDVAILAGLDPVALSAAELLAVAAFVERGGALMLLGGSHSFGNAEGSYLLLDPLLPVRILRGLDVEAGVLPTPSVHPIARGLPAPLGYIRKVHPVEPKPGAHVALRAGDLPLVVAGEFGYGRVVVVASYPECDEAEYGWFFTGDAFDDFLRSALAWMRKQHEPFWFESFSLPNRQVGAGNEEFGKARLAGPEAFAVRLTVRLADARGRIVHESSASLPARKTHEAIVSFRVPDGPWARGIHYVSVIASDAEGREVARRDVAVEVVHPTRLSLEIEDGRRAFAPGETARVLARVASDLQQPPPEVALDLSLLEEDGNAALAPRQRTVRWRDGRYEEVELPLPVPRLRPGAYRLRAELRVGGELADAADEELHILAPPPARAGFPLIADGGYHLDRASTERSVAEIAGAGANTLSLPGPPAWRAGEAPHREAMLAHARDCAARAGLALAHHRCGLVPGLSPAAPLPLCALTPEFRHALDHRVRPVLAAAARVPGLHFHEVASRAAVNPEQFCRCPACRAAYERNLGAELPEGEPESLSPAQRKALSAFVTSYWWHVLSAVAKLRDEAGAGVRLSLTFDATSFLRDGPAAPYCDAFVWARACETAEVAPEADLERFRLSLAGHQAILASLGKPLGAQLDLAVGRPPVAEAAYTAIARGVAHLRVADNPRYVGRRRQAPLPEALGGLFLRLGRGGPLLARSHRPPARAAQLFPFTEVAVNGGGGGVLAAFGLLEAASGGADLLHERLVAEGVPASVGAVALLGVRVVPKRVAWALVRFVEAGGLLLADQPAVSDEEGAPVEWPEAFFGTAETPVFGAFTVRRRRFGAGRTLLFSPGIAEAYRQAAGAGDAVATRELRRGLADALAEHGVRPIARADEPCVEVGLRACAADTWLLVAVNHSGAPRKPRIELDPALVQPTCAFDLSTGEPVAVERESGPALTLDLPPHDGGLFVLHSERPFTLRLEAPEAIAARGGSLSYKVMVLNESGRPAHGCHIVRVTVTDAAGRERPEYGGERVAAGGVLEVALPLAANERLGGWTVEATDLLTRRVVRRALEVVHEAPDSPPSPESQSELP
ncbi:MAG TPA: glutamine amidotransferase [Planctomycetota bacterium]|nr:glutamine amidotransferase [Planctomycetota bacterium]HRT94982.1 glutamine amidotransferase [Planctomycetota bacterium]